MSTGMQRDDYFNMNQMNDNLASNWNAAIGASTQDPWSNWIVNNQQREISNQQKNKEIANQKYGIDKNLEGSKYGDDTRYKTAQLEAQNSKDILGMKFGYADKVRGDIFSQMNSLYGSGGGGFQGIDFGQAPQITTGGVYNPQQIQGQINNQIAQNDARTAATKRDLSRSMASRGYGAGSPLLAALNAQADARNLGANNDAYRNTLWDAGSANAQQNLKSQQAAADAFMGYGQLQLGQQQNRISAMNPLFQLLGQIGSVNI